MEHRFVCPSEGIHRVIVRLHVPGPGYHGIFRVVGNWRMPLSPIRYLSANADPFTMNIDAGSIIGGEELVLVESPVQAAYLVDVTFSPIQSSSQPISVEGLMPFTKRGGGTLGVVVNPYPYVNYIGFGDEGDVQDVLASLTGVDEVHWEVVRNHCLYPTEVGESSQSHPNWPADARMATFAAEVDVLDIISKQENVVPLVCMNRHYHGDVRPFLQTEWARSRWHLLASNPMGEVLGSGHVMDHLWAEVEAQSTSLLREVRQRSGESPIHLDFTRGVALIGFGPPLRAAWAAHQDGERDLDALILAANSASPEEGPPFLAWDDLPEGIHALRCALSKRIIERMLEGAGIRREDTFVRLLLREPNIHIEAFGFDVLDWIESELSQRFCFHSEWMYGDEENGWSLGSFATYLESAKLTGVECHAGLSWFGTGKRRDASLGMLPGIADPHHVAFDSVPAWSAPDAMAIFQWASMVNEMGGDGLLLYDVEVALGSPALNHVIQGLSVLLGRSE